MSDPATGTTTDASAPARIVAAVEALLLAADTPLSVARLVELIAVDEALEASDVRAALAELAERYANSAAEVVEVATGWRLQVGAPHADLVARLWAERPPRLSRALLETLAIVVYRQPLARSDIEAIRGVSVSTNIIRTLLEYEWIKVVGHRDVPGRPALYATTPRFLDDFGVTALADLPSLPEIKDPAALEAAIARLGGTARSDADNERAPADDARDPDDGEGDAVASQTSDETAGPTSDDRASGPSADRPLE